MRFSLSASLIFGLVCAASANVITIPASRDNTIFQNNPDSSAGGAQAMFAGTNGQSSPRRALIGFDVASNLPAGATVTSVQLTLYLAQVAGGGMRGGGGAPTIDLFRISDDWGEGTAGGSTSGANGAGQGFTASTGDATWNARSFNTTNWTAPGGDFAAAASSSLQIAGTTLNIAYTWPSTSALVADVQSWLDAPASNFGWMLKNPDESSTQTFRAFWTREESRTDPSALYVPRLQITYAPEPVVACIAAVGVIALLRRR